MVYELRNVLDEIVSNSFPELKKQKINLKYEKLSEYLFNFGGTMNHYWISVESTLKKASKKLIQGGIAHELCHIVNDMNLSKYMKRNDLKLYKKNSRYRQMDERHNDLQVILRGYGIHLIELIKKCSKENEGLTVEEVKTLLKR
ncbi:MAG: hypothetical protein KKE23_01470 [Nanoarchaeota archaeon]|nr:hypothetical protein [Nanoarchaeota archaeon]